MAGELIQDGWDLMEWDGRMASVWVCVDCGTRYRGTSISSPIAELMFVSPAKPTYDGEVIERCPHCDSFRDKIIRVRQQHLGE